MMTEKTAKRIARALEQLAGVDTNISTTRLVQSLAKTHGKLQIVKIVKDVEQCGIREAKDITDGILTKSIK